MPSRCPVLMIGMAARGDQTNTKGTRICLESTTSTTTKRSSCIHRRAEALNPVKIDHTDTHLLKYDEILY